MNPEFNSELRLALDTVQQELIEIIKEIAKEIGIERISLVGGVIRDSIIDQIDSKYSNQASDIDLVIEGSATNLGNAIKNKLGTRLTKIHFFNAFDSIGLQIDGYCVDITTARSEIYQTPGANPIVKPSNLERDLERRDFRINAIALELLENKLLDPLGGTNDLLAKEIDFIHPKSVSDDPTRIIRGARYASRLNFKLTKNSVEQIKQTLTYWPWSWRHGDAVNLAPANLRTRLKQELNILFSESSWMKAIENLQSWGALLLLDEGLQNDQTWKRRVHWSFRLGITPLTALIAGACDPLEIGERLQIDQRQKVLISQSLEIKNWINYIDKKNNCLSWKPSRWCEELETNSKLTSESVALAICMGIPYWQKLFKWLSRWRNEKPPFSANDLIKEGWEPGEYLGKELRRSRLRQIDRKYSN